MYRIYLVGIRSYGRNDDEERGNEARYEGHEAHFEGVSGARRIFKGRELDYNKSIYRGMYREEKGGLK